VKPPHFYVHAGFCARRCSYCDFAVHVAAEPPVVAWATAVGRELDLVARDQGWSGAAPLRTLYLGGGTPSLLGPGAVHRLLDSLGPWIDMAEVTEFTAEANPESFSPALARDWVRAGVDRVSLGAQTFHGPSLRWMGRLHGPEGPDRAVRTARDAGLANIGLDLIFALPARLGRDLVRDLDRVLALEPEHVSVYGLSVESGTHLARRVASGRETMPEPERYREEYLAVATALRAAGYHHYEVSNFALPGREARHNAAYWSGASYLGLGNGAHSWIPPVRWWNERDWREYRDRLEQGERPRVGSEEVQGEAARLEQLWLGLRTDRGLSVAGLGAAQRELVHGWVRRGLAEADPERVRLTLEGWLLLDGLAVDLDRAAGKGVSPSRAGFA
jgi:oxygen-independent coproporphyrinogen III oxidase